MSSQTLSFAPGPSHLYPGAAQWIKDALESGVGSLSHRSNKYSFIHAQTLQQIRELLDVPPEYHIFFVSSATEAMERTVQNCARRHTYHIVNGSFSERFAQTAVSQGKDASIFKKKMGHGIEMDEISIPPQTELVCFTHNETSSGVQLPLEYVDVIKEAVPDALIAVDMVSSAPLSAIDLSQIDVAFFSIQKGFGLPAGLGVMIVSPRALQKSYVLQKEGRYIGGYHSFPELHKNAKKSQTPETPNVLGIYLLGKVAEHMNSRLIRDMHEENDAKIKVIQKLIDEHPNLSHFVEDSRFRSKTVVAACVDGGNSKLLAQLEDKNIIVGRGYGSDYRGTCIRIASFPATTIEDVERLEEVLSATYLSTRPAVVN